MTEQYLDGKKIIKIELVSDKTPKKLYIDGKILYCFLTLEDGSVYKQYSDGTIEEWRE